MTIEDFTDLSKLTPEKLLKLRDIARDHIIECTHDLNEANTRLYNICLELEERKNV